MEQCLKEMISQFSCFHILWKCYGIYFMRCCQCHFLWMTMLLFFIGEYKETELTRQISWHVLQAVNLVSNYHDIISTWWCVKSPAIRLFVQQPIWIIKQVISELCITHILCEEFTVTGGLPFHYSDISALASQITSLTIVYYTVYWGVDQRKHQSSVSLAFVWGIHRWQRASNVENASIWWRHHAVMLKAYPCHNVITSSHIISSVCIPVWHMRSPITYGKLTLIDIWRAQHRIIWPYPD